VDHPDLCLGAYAFTWGNKQEATATWYGMLMPDGSKLGAVDVMHSLWTGKRADHPCPRIESLSVEGDPAVEPGAIVRAQLKASDPSGDPLKVTWSLTADGGTVGLNGDKEDVPDAIKSAVTVVDMTNSKVNMPTAPGPYRLYAVVRNMHGGVAVANVPLRVRGAVRVGLGAKAKLPLTIYDEAGNSLPYVPSGWMGNAGAMKLDLNCSINPHSGSTCIKWDYSAADNWGGIAWQSPEGDWGDKPGGYDLTGARKLVLWARGKTGGEVVSFGLGLIKSDKKFPDTATVEPTKRTLTTEWQKIEMPLMDKDLTRIKVGLVMIVNGQSQPATIFLDDITIE